MPAPLLFKGLLWIMTIGHPYYVSVVEVECSSRNATVGVSCKIFTDDLEEALKKEGVTGLDLVKGDSTRNAQWIASYLRRHFALVAGGKPVELRFIGFENDPEATWCFFEQSEVRDFRSIRVTSDLLYETRREQINILHVTVDGERRSKRLVNPDRVFEATFK